MDPAKYAALFQAESADHLKRCTAELLAWERDPGAAAPVAELFRAIHSIKGMAAAMGYAGVADLSHQAETLLDAIRGGSVAATHRHFELLFAAVDGLETGVAAAARGESFAAPADLLEALEAEARPAAAPTAAPKSRRSRARKGAAPEPAAPAPAAPAAAPEARQVTVIVRGDAMMRGARALLALRKAEALGAVSGVQPAAAELERDDFDGTLRFRLESAAAPAAIEAALRAAGDIERVELGAAEAAAGRPVGRQIRIDLARLDRLMKLGGELVVARNRLLDVAAAMGDPDLKGLSDRIARLVGEMQGEVIAARMTPVSEVFDRFPRLVRDLGRELGKQVRLEVEGGDIELDRSVLDEIGDPLVHLVRNAIDHGIEPPAEREAAGKPAEGRLVLSATRERSSVALAVRDDGRGIDRARVLERARRDGLVEAGAAALPDEALLRVIGRSGFSTAAAVSGVSGRGVGVDVVLTRLRALGGAVELQTAEGRGTTFTLRVPFTLAVVRSLLVQVGAERYVIPSAYVTETVDAAPARLTAVGDREALVVRDVPVPATRLRRLLGTPGAEPPGRRPAVLVDVGGRRAALVVDALLGQQEIVVEPFDAPRGMPPWFGGATILADGTPALILDAASLA